MVDKQKLLEWIAKNRYADARQNVVPYNELWDAIQSGELDAVRDERN
jgi:hypothetical protein